jgi:hypothetical protein
VKPTLLGPSNRASLYLWPARSPDLNLLDFYLWGHLKSIVHAMAVNDVVELEQRIEDGCELIFNTAGIFEHMWQSLMRCATHCMEAQAKL